MGERGNREQDSPLMELVARTEGLQPWRRVFHAGNGVLIVAALGILPIDTWTALVLLGSILSVLLLMDGLRLTNPKLNRMFFQAFTPLASPREAGKVASSTWYVGGVLLALLLFPRSVALAGVLVLALADPAAGVVGRAVGTRSFGAGTVQGSVTFALVAFLCLLPFAPWWAALAAAVAATLVEALPWPVDDNLTIPPTAAGTLVLLTTLL